MTQTDFTLSSSDDTLRVQPNTPAGEAYFRDGYTKDAYGAYPFTIGYAERLCEKWRKRGLTFSWAEADCVERMHTD